MDVNYFADSHMKEDGTPEHEVWVRLGKTAMDLHAALSDEPVSGREAGRRSTPPVAKSTALRLLPVLAEHGLAEQTEDGWVRTAITLAEIAEHHGWTGEASRKLQRQRQHEEERLSYALGYLPLGAAIGGAPNAVDYVLTA